jgi:hypothetical protein
LARVAEDAGAWLIGGRAQARKIQPPQHASSVRSLPLLQAGAGWGEGGNSAVVKAIDVQDIVLTHNASMGDCQYFSEFCFQSMAGMKDGRPDPILFA